jgi:hypothetical protein
MKGFLQYCSWHALSKGQCQQSNARALNVLLHGVICHPFGPTKPLAVLELEQMVGPFVLDCGFLSLAWWRVC